MAAEMSRESRAMLLNVLWHHQGYWSEVGQPLRKLLGIERGAQLTEEQVSEAKWVDTLLARGCRVTVEGITPGVRACVAAQPAPVNDWSVARDCAACGRMATPGGPCQRAHGVGELHGETFSPPDTDAAITDAAGQSAQSGGGNG